MFIKNYKATSISSILKKKVDNNELQKIIDAASE